MQKKSLKFLDEDSSGMQDTAQVSRRKFLNYAGVSAAGAVLLTSCSKDLDQLEEDPFNVAALSTGGGSDGGKTVVNLGSGDIGILNYAYALEQLEAAFYIQVIATPYSGITTKETEYLTDVRDHEIVHREFFKNVLGNRRIGGLIVDFSSINFSSRQSVLSTAKAFEDTGVSAYNGAGELLQNPEYLLIAGKIVSVEARHAASIRDLLAYGSFADSTVVDSMGLDLARTPAQVLAIIAPFVKTKILAQNLPTS